MTNGWRLWMRSVRREEMGECKGEEGKGGNGRERRGG